jgi:quinoprotein glucose dehydrogenase
MSETIDPTLLKAGQQQFMVCGACHGQGGEGTAAAPPLAGSEWVTGPVENLIRIQFRGLQGPIKVKGQEYNFPAGMMPMGYQTDEQIAAVLTYVRNSFGNTASAVTTEEVAALRSEVGKPQLTVADLVPPPVPEAATTGTSEAAPVSTKYDNLKTDLGLPVWVVVVVLLFIGTSIVAAVRK